MRLFITGRLTPARSRAEAFAHMRDVHGPMVYDPPADAGPMPSSYAQNHGLAEADFGGWGSDRDFVTEIGFDDPAHLRAATTTPYYLERLRPDEGNFVDLPSVRVVLARRLQAQGRETEEPVRLFLFLTAPAAVAEDPSVQFRESLEALPLPAGPPPFAARIEVLSFGDRGAALAYARRRLREPAAGFALAADHYSVGRLKRERLSPR